MRLSKDMMFGLAIVAGIVLLKKKQEKIRLPTTVIDVSPGSPTADELDKNRVLPLILLPVAK